MLSTYSGIIPNYINYSPYKFGFAIILYLTGVHFRGELQHGSDVSQEKLKCRPIRTREIGGVPL